MSGRGNVQSDKCPVGEIVGEMSSQGSVGGELSSRGGAGRGSVGRGNVQSENCPRIVLYLLFYQILFLNTEI